MADPEAGDGEYRVRRQQRPQSGLERKKKKHIKLSGEEGVTPQPQDLDVFEGRRVRIENLESSTTTLGSTSSPNMTSDSRTTLPSTESGKSQRTRRRREEHQDSSREPERRRRRRSTTKGDSVHVYASQAERPQSPQRVRSSISKLVSRKESRDDDSEDSQHSSSESRSPQRPRTRKVRVVYITEEESELLRPKEKRVKTERDTRQLPQDNIGSLRSSKTSHSRRKSIVESPPVSPPKRSASTRDLPSLSRPVVRRSKTTSSRPPTVKDIAPSSVSGTTTSKRSSFLGSFFGSAVQQPRVPETLVECLTCLSDDIPRSKSAKLKCGHRMCHPCLRRIFKLSVTDPQHMPPKCCTADVIPLKHVDRLFDVSFKRNWNIKFQEYSTKNRIYCPARRCGEWIRPANIHKENGRKYGKCGRCKTKVCCLCNGKWHGTKDCPKDDETNALLEAAKQAGWQRCYSCRTMVELKEGCNHMTCHCKAQFCMLCGLKWKSCNCPWFNYETVEADRLNHMRVQEEQVVQIEDPVNRGGPEPRAQRLRRPRPNTYYDEMDQRRRQEREDEELARRLQGMAVGLDDEEDADADFYQGGIGDIHGVGNGAGHFMNQDYIRAAHNILAGTNNHAHLAANYVMGVRQARNGLRTPPALQVPPTAPNPPVLRRHTMREHAYNTAPQTRPSERVVPRRTRTDYASEAAVHAPNGRTLPRATPSEETAGPAILAGLGGSGRGGNRVDAWRTFVEPGVPADGVLSM